jgi:outer membrane receptor for ferrienterochelin and colicins
LNLDVNGFYTHFTNRIIADYFTDPNLIIYDNLKGFAVSKGVSTTVDYNHNNGLRINAGATLMNVYFVNESKEKQQQVFAPNFTANYGIGYTIKPWQLTVDFTGRTQGPMRLPILPNDYRPEYSPMYSLLNIQFTKKIKEHFELMLGVQNLLNFLPHDPIMRPFDPFDKNVNDAVSNPFGYSFDPSYNYAPMMKRRGVVGVRVNID